MLLGWCVVAALGGGRAAAASGPEGEKKGDSHARTVGDEAGQAGLRFWWHRRQGLPLEQEFDGRGW